jgi:hypothetical protein
VPVKKFSVCVTLDRYLCCGQFSFLSSRPSSLARHSPKHAPLRSRSIFRIKPPTSSATEHAVLSTPISSGRYGHLTETGSFKVIEKERDHFSTLYGRIEDARGHTIVADADVDMPVPRGGKFVPAPMRYFVRFNSETGMHAGYLPGYPASHGCVRLPEKNAIAIFNAVEVGTPVTVFGCTPRGREMNEARLRFPRRGFSPNDSQIYYSPPWWGR